jgi:hypothetical protein
MFTNVMRILTKLTTPRRIKFRPSVDVPKQIANAGGLPLRLAQRSGHGDSEQPRVWAMPILEIKIGGRLDDTISKRS